MKKRDIKILIGIIIAILLFLLILFVNTPQESVKEGFLNNIGNFLSFKWLGELPIIGGCNNDGICDSGEDFMSCPDCQAGSSCGDGICDSGEEMTCPGDCNIGTGSSCGDGVCDTLTEDEISCSQDCFCTPLTCQGLEKECGSADDGCGGSLDCGTCSSGKTCSNSKCVIEAGSSCGDGVCDAGEHCSNCGDCVCSGETPYCLFTTCVECTQTSQCDDGDSCTTDSCNEGSCSNSQISDCGADNDGDGSSPPADCNDNDANINPSATEVCDDAIDNDCDGDIDSADSDCVNCINDETRECGDSNIGECSKGIQTCSNNEWGSCVGEVVSVTEVCDDNKDNDCDGSVDEDCDFGTSGDSSGDEGSTQGTTTSQESSSTIQNDVSPDSLDSTSESESFSTYSGSGDFLPGEESIKDVERESAQVNEGVKEKFEKGILIGAGITVGLVIIGVVVYSILRFFRKSKKLNGDSKKKSKKKIRRKKK